MIRKFHYFLTHSPETTALRFGGNPDDVSAMRRMLWKYGMFYEEFQLFDCGNKEESYCSSFITECNRYEIYHKYNDRHDLPLFHDKYRVYEIYREFYQRTVCKITSPKDFRLFEDFVTQHPRFIVKPTNASCGYGVKIIDLAESSPEAIRQTFLSLRKSKRFICEELVVPHPLLARLNPTSLNTIRMVTIVREGQVSLFHPFL